MTNPSIAGRFVDALNDKLGDENHSFILNERGSKFAKIIHNSYGQISVHAFVEKATGQLIKAVTYKAPQKDVTGLAYRFDLSTLDGFDEAVAAADLHGSYLYKK